MFSLSAILDPLSVDQFLCDAWQTHSILQPAPTGHERFASLLSRGDVEPLAASVPPSGGLVQVVKAGKSVPPRLNSDQLLDLGALRRAYSDGCTIMLGRLHRRHPHIAKLCRDIEGALLEAGVTLSQSVTAGAFLTPSTAQAFGPHYDDHDIFVLQCEGSKEWMLYDYIDPTPTRPQYGPTKKVLPTANPAVTVRAGDMLYIPRGMYHEVRTSSSYSLHLSIGVYATTWLELFHAASETVPAFCKSLPRRGSEPQSDIGRLGEECFTQANLTALDIARAASTLYQKAIDRLEPVPGNGLVDASEPIPIRSDTVVRRNSAIEPHLVFDAAGKVHLLLGGESLQADARCEPVFRYVMTHGAFSVGELPDILSEQQKMDFVRQLILHGAVCADAATEAS